VQWAYQRYLCVGGVDDGNVRAALLGNEFKHGASPIELRFSARPTSGFEGTNPSIYNKPQSSSYSNMYLS